MNKLWIAITPLILLLGLESRAQTVAQVKNNKVLMELGSLTTQKGDDVFCLDAAQKRKGLLKVTQVKGSKAVAEIVKGACEQGMAVRLRRVGKAGGGDSASSESRPRRSAKKTGQAWGIVGGYHMDSAVATFTYSGTEYSSSMTGTGFSVSGLYDYDLTKDWQFRALAGIETFNTEGTVAASACNNGASSNCDFILMNLSFQGLAKYNFSTGSMRPWIGGGIGYIFALSKSSNVINTSELSTNWLYTLAGGLDWGLASGAYIPLSIEYSQFPDSATVKAGYIAVRGGWATSF
ncbi:MAG: hypothetical protein V4736_00395 [Bdellovibrionota bacterium]